MSPRSPFSIARRVFATVMITSLAASSASAGPKRLPLWSQLRSSATRIAVQRAARDAVRELESEQCRHVLTDFTDAGGHTLQERLDTLGQTAREYLQRILFADGEGQGRCQDEGVIAKTAPGSRVVFICPAQFEKAERQNPRHTTAIVIHEMLHSLGLGENPPTSKEITDRILARCR